jgi:hypothetical protein
MALIIGENTWATLAEAASYLNTRLGSGSWFTLVDSPVNPGDESKETFMIMAFNLLVNKPGYALDKDLTDDNVKYAQIEFALYLSANFNQWSISADMATKGLTSFTLSKWSEQYFTNWVGDAPMPIFVTFFLADYRMDNTTVNLSVD